MGYIKIPISIYNQIKDDGLYIIQDPYTVQELSYTLDNDYMTIQNSNFTSNGKQCITVNLKNGYTWDITNVIYDSNIYTLSCNQNNIQLFIETKKSSYKELSYIFDGLIVNTPTPTPTIKYSVTQNLVNCGTDFTGTELQENENFTINLTVNSGYKFYNGPTCNIGTVNISSDLLSATITGQATENIIITGNAESIIYINPVWTLINCTVTLGLQSQYEKNSSAFIEIKPTNPQYKITDYYIIKDGVTTSYKANSSGYISTIINFNCNTFELQASADLPSYTINKSLENLTSDIPDTIPKNENFNFTVYALTGYEIQNLTCNIGTVNISSDLLSATITGQATENIIITGNAIFVKRINITGSIINASCNYENGEIIDISKRFVISANTGYEFKDEYEYIDVYGGTQSLNKTSDNSKLYLDGEYLPRVASFNDTYRAIKKVEQISSFANLYNVTNEELTKLSKVRFYKTSGENVEKVDGGQYITDLYILPFNLDTDLLGDRTSIILGEYSTGVTSTLINNYIMSLNLGNITTPLKYNNVYDYLNTICILHLPFTENIEIDLNYIINQTVTINYEIDLYTGKATVNLYSTFINDVFYSKVINLSSKIPFMQREQIINSIDNNILNYLRCAFIEIVRNIPYNINSQFGKETIDNGILNQYTGFITISDIDLNVSATNSEKEQIISLLKSGVYINE